MFLFLFAIGSLRLSKLTFHINRRSERNCHPLQSVFSKFVCFSETTKQYCCFWLFYWSCWSL